MEESTVIIIYTGEDDIPLKSGREEVEEGLGGVRLADETSAVGVYSIQFRNDPIIK